MKVVLNTGAYVEEVLYGTEEAAVEHRATTCVVVVPPSTVVPQVAVYSMPIS